MLEVLEEARTLVEQGHCKGYFARDAKGEVTSLLGREAVSFCTAGAVYRVAYKMGVVDEGYNMVLDYFAIVLRELYPNAGKALTSVNTWNDVPERTTNEVIALYDNVIERVKSGEYSRWKETYYVSD